MNNILKLETKKYSLKLHNFEGPLDLLCHLVDKNKMDINEVKISDITDQYIDYINTMQEQKLEITSEFLIMASTLIYLKSKSLLPRVDIEGEEELTEEELIYRIIEYKKYKEISKKLKEFYNEFSKRLFKLPEKIELPNRKIEKTFTSIEIVQAYQNLTERNKNKINKNAINIEKIAIQEKVTVASKVKDIFKELTKKPKFIFNKLCKTNKYNKLETITAFSGVLELSKQKTILTDQELLFGDITIEKNKKQKDKPQDSFTKRIKLENIGNNTNI